MGLSPLSPTPLPSGSASTGAQRPISAMSQPITSSGYMLPQGAMPLPGLTTTSNGMLPNNNNYGNNNAINGHLNGPVSHSSPRVVDPYYWNQY